MYTNVTFNGFFGKKSLVNSKKTSGFPALLDGGGALYFLSWTLASATAKFPSSVKPRNAALNALQWIVCNPFFCLDFNIAQFLIDSGNIFSEYDQFGVPCEL